MCHCNRRLLYLEDDVRVVDAVHADARDDVGEEEGEPADDEHAHHRTQSLGSLLLLRELGYLLVEVEIQNHTVHTGYSAIGYSAKSDIVPTLTHM